MCETVVAKMVGVTLGSESDFALVLLVLLESRQRQVPPVINELPINDPSIRLVAQLFVLGSGQFKVW